ncbi:glycosyltransferase [Nodosilinea sp. LEGE 06152]|uniref:glycosyltransferase family 2 protein n=1 Tax=Nodosilinea sp. LEGE 06152 TaxID=2777966 RepID=UPI00187E6728|nr:glycosyltransferase [Nodosilinea sp. LEGE 06152]MBE9155754.1 glycosyltransferase [Nodosilinea sp. LEGE 06152]
MNAVLLVSIIINNYNYEHFLAKAIESALAQSYPHTEIIVVDDGSTDASRQIIARYGDRITAILQENSKQGAALNNGFAHSNGSIIIFLDADDYLYPNAVEQVVAAWQPDLAKLHYRLDVIDSEGNPRGFSYPGGGKLSQGNVAPYVISSGTYTGVPTSGNALSRQALAKVMPIPPEFYTTADDYLSVLMPLYGKVGSVETPLGAYRIHTSNQWALSEVTGDRFRRFIRHDLQRCELIQQRGRELGYAVPDDLYMRFFGRAWSRLASLRFDPKQHPVPSDTSLWLTYQGLRSLWLYSGFNWQKRIIFSVWFVWVGLAPQSLAKPMIVWLFAPQYRPKAIAQILGRLKALVNRSKPVAVSTAEDGAAS